MDEEELRKKFSPLKLLILIILGGLFQVPFIFIPAGNWLWIDGWVYIGIYILCMTILVFYMRVKNPQILESRTQAKKDSLKGADKIIMPLFSLLFIGHFILAGFDSSRYQWSSMTIWVKFIGYVILILSYGIIGWVMKINAFASKVLDVREEEGQKLITEGPYATVRHPMYSGFALMFFAMSFTLGSYYSLITAFLLLIFLIIRIFPEEKMLTEELEDYTAYKEQVKYRLIPGIF